MDIIFFAAVAVFIFVKLNKQLGKIDEEEKKQIEEKIFQTSQTALSNQQKIVGSKSTVTSPDAEKKILEGMDEATKQNFISILQRCNISAEFFVSGAKSAFEMVIKAFAGTDFETLKFLLSEKIYQSFESAINDRKSREEILTTNVILIEKCEVVSAMMLENTASIAVKFLSKQINYISDKSGQIVGGKKDEISEITDIWTFKKDTSSTNPNWIISITSH